MPKISHDQSGTCRIFPRYALPARRKRVAGLDCLEACDLSARPGRPRSAFWRRFWRHRRCNDLNRCHQSESFSRGSGAKGRLDGGLSEFCRRRHDGGQTGVDHDPLGPFVPRMQPDDGSVHFGAGRSCRQLRHVSVGKKQKGQQHTAGEHEVSTKGHAHHRCYEPNPECPSNGKKRQWFRI
jgi:hypothetical protein